MKQQEYHWKHKKRVEEGSPTEVVTADYFHGVTGRCAGSITFIRRGCTFHANI
jgi:hypothetical protein